MKSILFITLIIFISFPAETKSNDVVDFYKCLLLDSDVVYNKINDLVDAVLTLDPVKLITSFSTIYPVIAAEVARCSFIVRRRSNNAILKVIKNSSFSDFIKELFEFASTYITPFLKKLLLELKK